MLYLIRGLPNSGKTSFASDLQNCMIVADVFAADDFFYEKADKEGLTYSQAFQKYRFDIAMAHAQCLSNTRKALTNGCSVAVTNTFSTRWEIQPYIDMAKELGVQVTILTTERSPLATNKNEHNVPELVIDKMIQRWERI